MQAAQEEAREALAAKDAEVATELELDPEAVWMRASTAGSLTAGRFRLWRVLPLLFIYMVLLHSIWSSQLR